MKIGDLTVKDSGLIEKLIEEEYQRFKSETGNIVRLIYPKFQRLIELTEMMMRLLEELRSIN